MRKNGIKRDRPNGGVIVLSLLSLLICFAACQDDTALKQALIEKMVQEKIDNHIKRKRIACFKEAMEKALVIADSAMIKMALSKVDTTGKINRPAKPPRPEVDLPVDTTPIRPLFEDTITNQRDTTLILDNSFIIPIDTISNAVSYTHLTLPTIPLV